MAEHHIKAGPEHPLVLDLVERTQVFVRAGAGEMSINLNWRGEWTTTTEYYQYDMFSYQGSGYIGVVQHTSGVFATDLADGKIALYAQGANADTAAIHDNEANEISAITEKVSPVGADIIIIEDSEAAYIKKQVQITNLPGGGAVDSVNSQTGVVVLDTSHIDPTTDRNYVTDLQQSMQQWWNIVNGTFYETFDAIVTSDGATVTCSLEQDGTGDLTMRFSDGLTTLDCTPAATVTLTAGTDASPTENYVYIPQSTKVLTVSTSDWPSAEHIKVTYALIPSATFVQNDGPYINQNWNDHAAGSDNQGHLTHMAERSRYFGAMYHDGIAGNGATSGYITVDSGATPDDVWFLSTAGTIFQMHRHSFGAKDSATDDILVINDNTASYTVVNNLNAVLTDATGTTMSGKYFNLVFGGVANKGDQGYSPLFMNLPNGSYNKESDATQDVSGYDVYSIPRQFNKESSTGVLICRITLKHSAAGGGTWTVSSTVDLRGETPSTVNGGVSGDLTVFSAGNFRVFDPTTLNEIDLDLTALTANRSYTLPDYAGHIGAWKVTGSDIYFDTGKVGITETTPTAMLQVESADLADVTMKLVGAAGQTANRFEAVDDGDGTPVVIDADGLVGVGTANPLYALDIQRSDLASTVLRVQNNNVTAQHAVLKLNNTDQEWDLRATKSGEFQWRNVTSNTIPMAIEAGAPDLVINIKDARLRLNDSGLDYDFQYEALGISYALFIRGSDGHIGINESSPSAMLHVESAAATDVTAKLVGAVGQTANRLEVTDNAGTVADSVYVNADGHLLIGTDDDTAGSQSYKAVISMPTGTSDSGGLLLSNNLALGAGGAFLSIASYNSSADGTNHRRAIYCRNFVFDGSGSQTADNGTYVTRIDVSAIDLSLVGQNVHWDIPGIASTSGEYIGYKSTPVIRFSATSIPSFVGYDSYGSFDPQAGKTVTDLADFRARKWNAQVAAGVTITNRYGLLIDFDDEATTNPWGVYQTSANVNNFFGGKVGINETTIGAMLHVESALATDVTAKLVGASGQTADIFQVTNDAGERFFYVDSNRDVHVGDPNAVGGYFYFESSGGVVWRRQGGGRFDSNIQRPWIISSGADLVFSGVSDAGAPNLKRGFSWRTRNGAGGLVDALSLNGDGYLSVGHRNAGTAMVDIRPYAATDTGLKIIGASGQTANLFEIEDNAGTDLVVVDDIGNVGINKAAPIAALDVVPYATDKIGLQLTGQAGQTQLIFFARISGGSRYMAFDADGDWGINGQSPGSALFINSAATDHIALQLRGFAGQTEPRFLAEDSAQGTPVAIDSDGWVGIGTKTPAQPLHVYMDHSSTNESFILEQDGSGDPKVSLQLTGITTWSFGIDNSNNDVFAISNSTNLGVNNYFTVRSTGRIGINATLPAGSLEVEAASAGHVVGTFRGASGQTADIFVVEDNGGTDYLTVSSSGVLSLNTALAETEGGTGQSTYTAGDILYSDASNSLAKLAKGTAYQHLRMNSGATAPEWTLDTKSKSIAVEDPASGDRIPIWMNEAAVTVLGVSFSSVGGTSAVISVEYNTSIASGTVIHSDTCATATPEWDVTPSGTTDIPADQVIMLELGTVTGTVDLLTVTIHYRENA